MELSLILMVWNTSHLLWRTLYTLHKQTIKEPWELIVVDDNSEDDVWQTVMDYGQGLPVQYVRLEHDYGMRGNTASINTGVEMAKGRVVMWSTPEVMLPPGCLEAVSKAHEGGKRRWVTVPSHGLTAKLQLRIDEVDWQSNVHNIQKLVDGLPEDDWNSVWFYLNFFIDGRTSNPRRKAYGNNQTVAVDRIAWLSTIKRFPLFADYGTDDPWVVDERRRHQFEDVTLWGQEAYHQWHPTAQFWIAHDKAPNWNKFGHTTSNVMNDPKVPANGTSAIWDGGLKETLSPVEKRAQMEYRPTVLATGFRRKGNG